MADSLNAMLDNLGIEASPGGKPAANGKTAKKAELRDHETDLGNARRWCIDQTGAIERRAKDTIKKMWQKVASCNDRAERDRLIRHANRSESAQRIAAMIALARTEEGIPIMPEVLDADPWLLNAENGTIDLRTGELRPHAKSDLITKLAPTVYDPDAKAPLWERFVAQVFDDQQELIDYSQRAFGSCLSGNVSEQTLLVLYGRGANGKSTLVNAGMDVLGEDYALKAPPDFLTVKRNGHPTELTDLFGRRLVVATETEEGRRLAESLVKELTGTEKIRARRMREDFWQFNPTHSLVLCTNHKPEIRGTDHGIWRRLQLIPFNRKFEGSEQDKDLPDKLAAESPGIFAWLVQGCVLWRKEKGLRPPKIVDAATEEYRKEQDSISKFFEECCILDNVGRVQASALLKAYHEWAGEKTLTQKRLAAILEERAFDKVLVRNRSFWLGLELASDRDPKRDLVSNTERWKC